MSDHLSREVFDILQANLKTVLGWPEAEPDGFALRCAQSRHRTLAHLRACQEQWLWVVSQFEQREVPVVRVLHPWRKFESELYDVVTWSVHRERFWQDRAQCLERRATLDLRRAGKWNGKPDTIGGLLWRLAEHETYHLETLRV